MNPLFLLLATERNVISTSENGRVNREKKILAHVQTECRKLKPHTKCSAFNVTLSERFHNIHFRH